MPTDRLPVSTPQFRTSLLRKLKNMFPGLEVRIEDAPKGIIFQLLGPDGRARTKEVSIFRNGPDALTSEGLKRRILNAGRPAGGFPEQLGGAG